MTSNDLKKIIENEAKARKLAVATLCRLAVDNNRLHRTLSNGGTCTLDVADRFVKYIEKNPSSETPNGVNS